METHGQAKEDRLYEYAIAAGRRAERRDTSLKIALAFLVGFVFGCAAVLMISNASADAGGLGDEIHRARIALEQIAENTRKCNGHQ